MSPTLLRLPAATALAAGLGLLIAGPAAAAGPATVRVSVSTAGRQGDGLSGNADRNQAISGDGRVVAFYSEAAGITPRDRHGQGDVVVRDLPTGRTTLASVSSSGALGNGFSTSPALDGTGRRVAFVSYASNLVPDDTNDGPDVFVRDREAGTTTRVSVTGTGGQVGGVPQHPALSADGRFVAFDSGATELLAGSPPGGRGATQVFVHDLVTGATEVVSTDRSGHPGNGESGRPSLSADGSRVAFASAATDLVPGDTNADCGWLGCSLDAFVRDRAAGTTRRVSVRPDGSQGVGGSAPSISADGQRVAMLGDGLVPGDTTSADDVYLRDLAAGTTTLLSRSRDGVQAGTAPGPPELSGDGRTVAFSADEPLVPRDTNGETDVFVCEVPAHTLRLASVSSTGGSADAFSIAPDVSGDGRRVVFLSYATNLVPDDTNGALDVFVRRS